MKHLLLPVVSTVSDLTTYNYPRVYSGMKVAVESEDYRAYKLLGADHTIAANWFPIEEIPIVKYSDTSSIQTGNSKFLFFVDDDEGNVTASTNWLVDCIGVVPLEGWTQYEVTPQNPLHKVWN